MVGALGAPRGRKTGVRINNEVRAERIRLNVGPTGAEAKLLLMALTKKRRMARRKCEAIVTRRVPGRVMRSVGYGSVSTTLPIVLANKARAGARTGCGRAETRGNTLAKTGGTRTETRTKTRTKARTTRADVGMVRAKTKARRARRNTGGRTRSVDGRENAKTDILRTVMGQATHGGMAKDRSRSRRGQRGSIGETHAMTEARSNGKRRTGAV